MADTKDDYGLEILKGRVTLAVEALKILAAINGGAGIAVLTYLGHIAKDGSLGEALAGTRLALLLFGLGLLSAVLAFIVAYAAQAQLHDEHRREREGMERSTWHAWWVIAGMVLALVSALLFGAGAYVGAYALTTPR